MHDRLVLPRAYGAVEGDVGMCVVEGTKVLQTPTVHLSSTTRRAILHYEGTFRGEGGQPALLHTCLARVTCHKNVWKTITTCKIDRSLFFLQFCVTASSTHRQSTDFLIQACHTHCLTAALGL